MIDPWHPKNAAIFWFTMMNWFPPFKWYWQVLEELHNEMRRLSGERP